MKKAILSLAAVLTMFASVPAFAAPMVDPESTVSANESAATEPTVNIIYQSELDVRPDPRAFYDARDVKGKDSGIGDFTLKSGERKVVEYIQLSQGQKVGAAITRFNITSSDGSKRYSIEPTSTNRQKELVADKDGYYLIEYTAPKSDAKEYTLVTASSVYGKQ